MSKKQDKQIKLYREQMGDEAADRQAQLAKYQHGCCGFAKDGPHHPACPKRKGGRY